MKNLPANENNQLIPKELTPDQVRWLKKVVNPDYGERMLFSRKILIPSEFNDRNLNKLYLIALLHEIDKELAKNLNSMTKNQKWFLFLFTLVIWAVAAVCFWCFAKHAECTENDTPIMPVENKTDIFNVTTPPHIDDTGYECLFGAMIAVAFAITLSSLFVCDCIGTDDNSINYYNRLIELFNQFDKVDLLTSGDNHEQIRLRLETVRQKIKTVETQINNNSFELAKAKEILSSLIKSDPYSQKTSYQFGNP